MMLLLLRRRFVLHCIYNLNEIHSFLRQHYPMGLGKSIEEHVSPQKEAAEAGAEEEEDTI